MLRRWIPSLVLTIAAAIGVALGAVTRRFSPRLVRLVLAAIIAGAAVWVWLATRNPYFLLPFAGVLVGLFHRRERYVSIFD